MMKTGQSFYSVFLTIGLIGSLFSAPGTAQEPFGCWSFSEQSESGSADLFANSAQNDFPAKADRPLKLGTGVLGTGLDLSGAYKLEVSPKLIPDNIEQITVSAWVRVRKFDAYNEILRKEDGIERFLFSFQDGGNNLSLGLNIANEYLECDAPITPGDFLDGTWHFVAGTFDGNIMRVYKDGQEIHSREQKGPLRIGKPALIYIGSSAGSGEFFDGELDEVKIYNQALTDDAIQAEFNSGKKLLDEKYQAILNDISAHYNPGENFVQTVLSLRQKYQESPDFFNQMDTEYRQVLSRFIHDEFPVDFNLFSKNFKMGLYEAITLPNSALRDEAQRLFALYTEYKPLTPEQWQLLSEEETKYWKHVEDVEREFLQMIEAEKPDDMSGTSAPIQQRDWFAVAFEISKNVKERPYMREPVAPYHKPSTPEVVDLSGEEAQAKLQAEWLFQCDNAPTKERIADEIDWTTRLIDRLEENEVELDAEREQLAVLQNRLESEITADSGIEQLTDLYFQVRELKRAIMFKNPVLNFDSILYVDIPYPEGSEWRHETRHRLGYMAVPGGRLMTLTGLSPAGKQKQLMPRLPLHGSFWRPDLSWDAKRVVFSFKPHNEKAFHLYEMDLDGGNLHQITGGIFDDFDPIYLPDNQNIVFSTTRGYSYVRCMPPTNAFVLARINRDSSNLYLISRNNEPDYLPSLLPDGRIVFSRWEYTDKPLWRCVSLWTMNPDGTQTQVLWGNQTVWPDLPKDVRAIPESNRLMFIGSAHHDWFAGSIGIIDPSIGMNFPEGLTKVTAEIAWPECGNGPVDPIESPNYHREGNYTAYDSPYPLSETDFLVSACRNNKYVLLLMDTDGNRELIYEGYYNILYAQPIRPRDVPPVIQDRVDWPTKETRAHPKEGIIYSNNVYDNAPPELQGKAKYLRIMNIEPKTYTFWDHRPYISTGPVVSMVQSEGVKRILGTVPIEEDGSVSFYAPSGTALHFQLLDEEMRCLQTMRSFTGVMPGERRGCLGCHESQVTTPSPQVRSIAVTREPSTITPPPWNDISVSYERYVQPVLDKHCGSCHSGEGEAREIFDTTLRPGFLHFKEPYITLIGNPSWGSDYHVPDNPPPGFGIADTILVEGYNLTNPDAYITPKPMEKLSYASRLVNKYCVPEHYGVSLDPVEKLRVMVWIDAMCPYLGTDDIRNLPDPKFQGSDWIAIPPRLETAPVVRRPGPFDPFESDEAYNPPTDQQVYGNPANDAAPIIKRKK